MTGVRRTRTARRVTLLGTAVLLALAPALGVQAEPAALPANDVARKVARELDRLGGAAAMYDDSSMTKCMYDDPEPLTYSTREIVLRDNLTDAQAKQAVGNAIGTGSLQVGSVERIVLPSVPSAAPAPGGARVTEDAPLTPPLLVVSVKPHPETGAEVNIVQLARDLRAEDILASPNYFMSPSKDGPIGVFPNGYPQITTLRTTPRASTLGTGVDVWVYDVGLAPSGLSAHPPNVKMLNSAIDGEVLDVNPADGKVDRYYGAHFIAIADVFATLVPAAKVTAIRVTDSRGIVTDVSSARRMAATLQAATNPPEIIVNSFGTGGCDVGELVDSEMVPLGLEAISEAIDARGDSVLVAAAGNRSTDRQFYPGALDTDTKGGANDDVVIGVGALDVRSPSDPVPDPNVTGMWTATSRSGPPADYSNYGPWVDAWAPGSGLPVRHVDNLRFLLSDPLPMDGRGLVDGTSFAAPYVGGLIAEQIARTKTSPLAAWQAIAAQGAVCDEVLGGVAVALTSMAAPADTKGVGTSECVAR